MNIFASFEPIFMWFWDEIPHPWGFTQLWVFTQWWEANENWLFQFWPITGVLTQWWGTNRIVFLPGGKWSDWLRVICFVFKIVVPKHRFCKLQNVWNVCEFGSDYKSRQKNIFLITLICRNYIVLRSEYNLVYLIKLFYVFYVVQ